MSEIKTVCLGTCNSLRYPQGGYLWIFLNWAAGFRAHGCRIIWLDIVELTDSPETLQRKVANLRSRIAPYGLADSIALVKRDGASVEHEIECFGLAEATSADLLFDLRYDFPDSLVKRFRRSALLDIDPGILQTAMQRKELNPARYDVYFTIGETVDKSVAGFPSFGIDWTHVPPCVSTEHWSADSPSAGNSFTTVSHWYTTGWMVNDDGSFYKNDKRSAFLPFLELPKRVSPPLELAIHLAGDSVEREFLKSFGWRVREAHEAVGSPADFHKYVQPSRGEFRVCKTGVRKDANVVDQ
jgi:hypothetical protein